MRSSSSRPAGSMARAPASVSSARPRRAARPGGSGVVEAVVVALVAVDRGERRVQLERALPGARARGRQGRRIRGVGHGASGTRPRRRRCRRAGGRVPGPGRGGSLRPRRAAAGPAGRRPDRARGTAAGRRGSGVGRAAKRRRASVRRTCQLPASMAARRTGDPCELRAQQLDALRREDHEPDDPLVGRRCVRPRRRTGSPSIAVHSTSNRKANRGRTYQQQSTCSRASAPAPAEEAERRVALVGQEPRAERPAADAAGLLARGDEDVEAEPVAEVGQQADHVGRARGTAPAGRRGRPASRRPAPGRRSCRGRRPRATGPARRSRGTSPSSRARTAASGTERARRPGG